MFSGALSVRRCHSIYTIRASPRMFKNICPKIVILELCQKLLGVKKTATFNSSQKFDPKIDLIAATSSKRGPPHQAPLCIPLRNMSFSTSNLYPHGWHKARRLQELLGLCACRGTSCSSLSIAASILSSSTSSDLSCLDEEARCIWRWL